MLSLLHSHSYLIELLLLIVDLLLFLMTIPVGIHASLVLMRWKRRK
jgi:hypothetical protein